jgi:hypothetical protein
VHGDARNRKWQLVCSHDDQAVLHPPVKLSAYTAELVERQFVLAPHHDQRSLILDFGPSFLISIRPGMLDPRNLLAELATHFDW